jgi:hypothetical protein
MPTKVEINEDFIAQCVSITDNPACSPLMKSIIEALLIAHADLSIKIENNEAVIRAFEDLRETWNTESVSSAAQIVALSLQLQGAQGRIATLESALAAKENQNPLPENTL